MMTEDEKSDMDSRPSIVLELEVLSVSEYIGQNSFGVKVKVRKLGFAEYGVVVAGDSRLIDEPDAFAFAMDRREAKECLPSLRLRLDGEITSAAIFKLSNYSAATISDPHEESTISFFVPFRVDNVHVVDVRTGKIVHDFEPGTNK
jgi:hypothetical protein